MKTVRILLLFSILAVLVVTAGSVNAQATLDDICSGVQIQNKGDVNAVPLWSFYQTSDNDGVADYTYQTPSPGFGVNVSQSKYMPDFLPSTLPSGNYSVLLSSNVPLNSLINQVDCDLTAPRVGSSHSGFELGQTGTELYLPFVLSRVYGANWSSAIAIQNAGSSTATNIRIDFYAPGSSTPTTFFTNTDLKVGETWYLDLSSGTYATPALNHFSGTAKITSNQEVAAIANYATGTGDRMLSYNGVPVNATSQTLFATQLMRNYTASTYVGGFVLYNPNGTNTPVTLSYYQTGASAPVCTRNISILANSVYIDYLGGAPYGCTTGSLPDGFNGYMKAHVTSGSNRIVGIFNFDSSAGQAGAANMVPIEQSTDVLYYPQIVRTYSGYESGWQIVNTTGGPITVDVEYYRTNGTLSHTQNDLPVPANAVFSQYVGSPTLNPLGTNWNGGAKVIVNTPGGGIVGQANFVSLTAVETLLIYNGFNP